MHTLNNFSTKCNTDPTNTNFKTHNNNDRSGNKMYHHPSLHQNAQSLTRYQRKTIPKIPRKLNPN